MKIRLISDLHIDINRKYNVTLPDDDVYTLIAGDIGGDYKDNAKWLRNNIRKGAFISGNHDAYTPDNTPLDDVKKFYHEEFPLDGDITYFDSDVGVITKKLDNKTILVADVLYTDYKYRALEYMKDMSISEVVKANMRMASPKMSGCYMNDFMFLTRNGKYNKSSYDRIGDGLFYLTPENYREHFDKAFKEITSVVEENSDKNIILMTHHCLSPKAISSEYSRDSLNASYVSNKENWIRKHSNIKLILSGHVHGQKIFNVGMTKYVLNPLGYLREVQNVTIDKKTNKTVYWSPDTFIDTKTWEITTEKYINEEWNRIQKERTLF